MLAKLAFDFHLWKLQRAKRRRIREYEKATRGLRINKAGGEKREELRNDYMIDMEDIKGAIAELQTRYLIDVNDRLLLPPPDPSDWADREASMPYFYLTHDGVIRLRAAIRQEQKARWEARLLWLPLLTGLTGIIGTLIGLIAVLRK